MVKLELKPAILLPYSGRASSVPCGAWGRLAGVRCTALPTWATGKAVPQAKAGSHRKMTQPCPRTMPHRSYRGPLWRGRCERRSRLMSRNVLEIRLPRKPRTTPSPHAERQVEAPAI